MRRLTRWLTPTTLALAASCFLLPFATVSCGTPGGYGRVRAGGGTEYSGADLAFGGAPAVDEQFLLPAEQWRPDRLPPQPLALAVLGLLAVGLAVAVLRRDPAFRRAGTAAVSAAAALLLLGNQARVESLLAERVQEQVRRAAPQAPLAADHVQTGSGFWFCLILLLVLCLGNAAGWWRLRRRARAPAAQPGAAVAGGRARAAPGARA
ncbi:MAG TPA: hypothetical protein VFM54_05450 [Micromonosporaceae bacterium]|nr:hypothetical protein [Micromonosporaceae bacterium]